MNLNKRQNRMFGASAIAVLVCAVAGCSGAAGFPDDPQPELTRVAEILAGGQSNGGSSNGNGATSTATGWGTVATGCGTVATGA